MFNLEYLASQHKPGVVISCFTTLGWEPSALPVVLSEFLGMQFVTHDGLNSTIEWDVWATCSTSSRDRIPPAMARSLENSLVMFLPGKCLLAAKAGLWQGLESRFGVHEAEKIAPRTIVRPAQHETLLREYLDTLSVNTTFVTKSGHRQRGIQELKMDLKNKPEFIRQVLELQPVVIQVKQESIRYNNRRTAFRTYTWIQCKPNNRASAIIDWNSPAYVAVEEHSLIASGYTSAAEEFSTHELLTKLGIAHQVKSAVQRKVSKVLVAFGSQMCQGYVPWGAGRQTEELFALDWIPTGSDAMLLEVNRFPDIRLHYSISTGENPIRQYTKKDWLKVCTHLRRFPEQLVLPAQRTHHRRCLAEAQESIVEMI
ncbi:hypothetical protein BASA81_008881 [Batrachochytrium salamandrivorans]|nr:hypothetical protein BASA81_008881 [Batrachochytrium salamandrivorans]